jgi:tetratricopeptide (TPR) repeat protein
LRIQLRIAAAGILLLLSGCAWNRSRVHEDLVSARQLALQAIDARQRGRLEQAEALFGQATEMCPLDERIRSHYAETLWDAQRREQAVQHMEEAVRLSAGNPELMVRLGEMYLEQGRLEQADAQATLATDKKPQLAAGWALRGDVLRAQGRDADSLASYHRAISLQSHYPHVQLAVADIYRNQQRPGRALATLRTLADGYPPGETPTGVLFLQGIAMKDLQRYDAAAKMLSDIAQQGEATPELLLHLAEAQWLAGDPVNAQLTVQSALRRVPPDRAGYPLIAQLQSLEHRLSSSAR